MIRQAGCMSCLGEVVLGGGGFFLRGGGEGEGFGEGEFFGAAEGLFGVGAAGAFGADEGGGGEDTGEEVGAFGDVFAGPVAEGFEFGHEL